MGDIFYQIDAFSDKPFAGNPAAVFVLPDGSRQADWMQLVAREMNLAETAFLHKLPDGGDSYALRWFTPVAEVDLCGHATLASAHVLWETGQIDRANPITFHTRSGALGARLNDGWIELDFPATVPTPLTGLLGFADSLGASPRATCKTRFDVLVELESESAVRNLVPDMARLRKLDVRGVIVTAKANTAPFDFVSRFFAPKVGVDEDPVTGSAHCALGPYWAAKLGKTDLLAYQASPRGGVVRVSVRDDRVLLGGQAVTVFRGELL